MAIYLDASALVKLLQLEPESAALRRFLDSDAPQTSSAIATVEVMRAVRAHHSPELLVIARDALGRLDLVELDETLLDAAAQLEAPLRTLDAIHLATALTLGAELQTFITYDLALRGAAAAAGLPVASPGRQA